jgi:peptidoglycan hydrolase-like protein with peptidoglycan-binding domain
LVLVPIPAATAATGDGTPGAPTSSPGVTQYPVTQAPSSNPFDGRGLWIWQLARTESGNLATIAAKAQTYGINTIYLKSSDGSTMWSQFTPYLVQALHQSGLKVCAWQYVYGTYPDNEAAVGATAVKDGADCLVIDAEGEYDGRYTQAQRYLTLLRRQVGQRFPIALAGLPYVDYHPSFPYSVFLGPGGAQYDMPQMYWYDIGTSVDAVYDHTYRYNEIYGRPIYPLGELTGPPPVSDIFRFRQLSIAYGAFGISWWLWQDATPDEFQSLSEPLGALANFTPATVLASIHRGQISDLVVWAQEHLVTAGQRIAVDGDFGPATQRAVIAFQTGHGIAANGVVDPPTWTALLQYRAAFVHWWLHVPKQKPKPEPKKKKSKKSTHGTTTKRARAAIDAAGAANIAPPTINAPLPQSARARDHGSELRGAPGRGGR